MKTNTVLLKGRRLKYSQIRFMDHRFNFGWTKPRNLEVDLTHLIVLETE